MTDVVKCIDISHWQNFPDFRQVREAGVIAMIHKCTEGLSTVDPNRATNCSNALKAGVAFATYHWLSPGKSPTEQMKFYLDTLRPVHGERVVIDYEQDGCTVNDLEQAVRYLKADPRDLQVTIYSGHLLKQQLGNGRNDYLAANTDLWLAQYTTPGNESWPQGTYPEGWTLWQYSEKGQVPGIDGVAVDLNKFHGTDEELLEWIKPAQATQRPAPGSPMPAIVTMDIKVPPGAAVAIRVNGVQLVPGSDLQVHG